MCTFFRGYKIEDSCNTFVYLEQVKRKQYFKLLMEHTECQLLVLPSVFRVLNNVQI